MSPNNRTVAIVLLSLLLLQGVPYAAAQAESDLIVTSVVTKTQAVVNKPVQVVITVENIGGASTTSRGFEVYIESNGQCLDAGDDEETTPPNPPNEPNPANGCTQTFVTQNGVAPGAILVREFTWMPTSSQNSTVPITATIRSLSGTSGTTLGAPDARSGNNVRRDLAPLIVVTPKIEATPDREIIDGRKLNDAWRLSDVEARSCPTVATAIIRYGCMATPGQVLNYRYYVHNKGNRQDVVVPSFVNIGAFQREGWEFFFTSDSLAIPANGTAALGVVVVVPKDAEAGKLFNVNNAPATVRVRSGWDAGTTTEPNDPTLSAIKVKRVFGLNVTHGHEMNQTTTELLRIGNVTQKVRFDLLLNNSGNEIDDYAFKFIHGSGTINDSWRLPDIPVQKVRPGTENRTPLRFELEPPVNATRGLHSIDLTIQSTHQDGGDTFRKLRLTIDLQQNFTIEGQVLTGLVSRLPADPASFAIKIDSRGNGHDNVTLRLDPMPPGWTGGLSRTVVPVEPFGESIVYLNVTPPINAPKDQEFAFYVNGTSAGPVNLSVEQRSQTGMLVSRVRIREGSNIAATPISATDSFVDVGEQVTYSMRVTNTGNVRDRFQIEAVSDSAAWRTPTFADPIELEPGQSRDVSIAVTAPSIAPVGETNVVNVRVSSQSDTLLDRTLGFTGRISGPDLVVGQVALNSTDPYAGDVIVVNVPIANEGNRAPTQNATLRVYLVKDGSETEIGNRTIDPTRLRGGARLTESFAWNDTLNYAGEGVLIAVIDPADVIDEIEDSASSNEKSLAITLRTFDLRVRAAQGLSVRPGQEVTYGEAPYTFVLEHRGNSPSEPVRVLVESENGWGRRQIDVDLTKGVEYNVTVTLQVPERPGVSTDRLNLTVVPRLRQSAALHASTLTTIIDDGKPEIAGVTIVPGVAVFGEPVRISAIVRDATGLQSVKAVVVSPDDQRRTVDLAHEEGDTWSATQSFSFAGQYRVYVEAVDGSNLANSNSSRETVVTFDVNAGTAPIVRLAEGQSPSVRTGALVKLNLSDPNGIGTASYTYRGITYDLAPPYHVDTSSFPEGNVDLIVTAANIYGVETSETIRLTLDNSAAGITSVTVTPEKPKVNEDVTLRIETDAGVQAVDVIIKRDGQIVETRAATKERDGLFTLLLNPGQGDYSIDVSAKDAAGNVELESGAVVFSAKPASFIPGPGAGMVWFALVGVALGLAGARRGRRNG